MKPNITNHIHILPRGKTLSGGEPFTDAWIETQKPSFAHNSREIKEGFFRKATDIIVELSGGKLIRENIYTSSVYTVDGSWNMDGRAMTNEQPGEVIVKG